MSEPTVVTSENAAEFYAQKLNLPKEEAKAEEVKEAPQEQEEIKAEEHEETRVEETEEQPQEKKGNPKLQARFSELTRARDEAREEAAREKQARADLERRLQELENKANPKPQEADEDARPDPAKFMDAFEYAEKLADWSARQAIKNKEKQDTEAKQNEERNKVVESWKSRQDNFAKETPDYRDMIESSDISVADHIRDAIIESEVGPHLLYHLASNPEVAEKLNGMKPINALREIGKLEAKLEKSKAEEKPAPRVSKAPEPINPIKGSGIADTAADGLFDSNGEFTGTPKQWRELRAAGKIK